MEDQLITFETAKLAKEKECPLIKTRLNIIISPVPTQSLLQKWLREVHNIHITIWYNELTKKYRIDTPEDLNESEYESYENALEIVLQEILKLIP